MRHAARCPLQRPFRRAEADVRISAIAVGGAFLNEPRETRLEWNYGWQAAAHSEQKTLNDRRAAVQCSSMQSRRRSSREPRHRL
jgi:hypothetical protein